MVLRYVAGILLSCGIRERIIVFDNEAKYVR